MTERLHNIVIDGTDYPYGETEAYIQPWEEAILRNLLRVFDSAVGGVLELEIAATAHTLRIVPNMFRGRYPEGWATSTDSRAASLRGQAAFFCSGVHTPTAHDGLGTGSDVVIELNPERFFDPTDRSGPMPSPEEIPGGLSDEMLCHELVHALRSMQGVEDCQPIAYGYDTFEEFCAVLVSNVYSSQFFHGRRPLRADHHGFRRRDQLLNPFGGVHPQIQDEILFLARMRHQQPLFTAGLAAIPYERASYNPFRDGFDTRVIPITR